MTSADVKHFWHGAKLRETKGWFEGSASWKDCFAVEIHKRQDEESRAQSQAAVLCLSRTYVSLVPLSASNGFLRAARRAATSGQEPGAARATASRPREESNGPNAVELRPSTADA